MKYNGYSVNQFKEIYNMGIGCKTVYEVMDKLEMNGYHDVKSTEIACLGMENGEAEIEEKTWYRIGEPIVEMYGNYYKNSYNYAEDRPEAGISVINSQWLNSLKSIFFGVIEKVKTVGVYEIKGIQIGTGGDDEPLIYATDWAKKTRIRSVSGLRKLVKNAENI